MSLSRDMWHQFTAAQALFTIIIIIIIILLHIIIVMCRPLGLFALKLTNRAAMAVNSLAE